MTTPEGFPKVIWLGTIDNLDYRVVDRGPNQNPRLTIEIQGLPDAMGARGWSRQDPISVRVFEQMLVQAGIVV